jgi:hypothetical protein
MVFKLSSNGFSMDIKFKKKRVFNGVSIEKKIQEGHHHRPKLEYSSDGPLQNVCVFVSIRNPRWQTPQDLTLT